MTEFLRRDFLKLGVTATARICFPPFLAHKKELPPKRNEALEKLTSDLGKEIRGYEGDAGIVVLDLLTQDKISINGDKPYYPASLVKAFVLAAVLKDIQNNQYSLSSVNDQIVQMMKDSDNAAASNLIHLVGMEHLNEFVKLWNLKNTEINNGFDDSTLSKGSGITQTTLNDEVEFWRKLYRGEILNQEYTSRAFGFAALPSNEVVIIPKPSNAQIYHKGGWIFEEHPYNVLTDAGVIMMKEKGRAYIIALYTQDSPSFYLCNDLAGMVNSYFKK